MQSDLVGAHAMGIRNVLLTTGNPTVQGSYADATSVFDVDAIGLTNMVVPAQSRARHRRSAARRGDAVSHRASPSTRLRRTSTPSGGGSMHKVEAGAEFLVTPPILDVGGV